MTGLVKISQHYRLTEFVVAFFLLALAATLPNLFVGISAALQGIPELSFGDIMGNNMISLTLVAALGIFLAPKKHLPLESEMIQNTTFFTGVAAILPLLLISDGGISRSDGLILVLFFAIYVYWLLRKSNPRQRATISLREESSPQEALIAGGEVLFGVVLVGIAAQTIVYGGTYLANEIGMSLLLVGMLVIGFGGALPELYFTALAAKRGETDMIVGNLMGVVIIPATFVLGVVAMISPIANESLELPVMSRVFLVIAAVFFLIASQTKSRIERKEGYILVVVYLFFLGQLLFFA